ncbi:MAG: 16S rRNA (uracil(1498)-N(3))-methyltransferase [Candidatus Omnitrophica bacterium]|nr:16S rRNA (uracil(1498)-N(3))-methyltransferase [Candidatus Omnitrophota bacterium]
MNLILLLESDFISSHRVRLSGRRFLHIQDILKAQCGQSLTVGKINGLLGKGTLVHKENDAVELEVNFNQKPPGALPLTLILALQRPPMLKRILFSAAMLGIKKIIILNFNRVEKSLWNSSALKPQSITEQLVLGLEQAKDTLMPEVILKKGFKSFVDDELPALIKGNRALVAHPGGGDHAITNFNAVIPCASTVIPAKAGILNQPITLIIGPEGGIIDYEIELLESVGCQTIDLGPRIFRTESVLPYIVGKLF